MKLLNLGFIAGLLLSSVTHAVNPIPGWYAGIIVGGSKPPAIHFNVVNPLNDHSGLGVLTYSVLGNVGVQAGYRVKQFRAEGEFFYNNNPYSHLQIGGVNIPNAGSTPTTPQQLSIQDKTIANPFTFKGYTNTYALMLNGFYDFYIPEYTEHVVPYVGLGVGYDHVENNIIFYSNDANGKSSAATQKSVSQFTNNFAGQAILGLSYYLTDHTSFALDYRYLSSTRTNKIDSRYNSFQSRPQIYSVNFVFNVAFYLA